MTQLEVLSIFENSRLDWDLRLLDAWPRLTEAMLQVHKRAVTCTKQLCWQKCDIDGELVPWTNNTVKLTTLLLVRVNL